MKFDKILELAENNIAYINVDNEKQYIKVLKESFKRNIYWCSGDKIYNNYLSSRVKCLGFRTWDDNEKIEIIFSSYLHKNDDIDYYDEKIVNVFNFNQVEFDDEELE